MKNITKRELDKAKKTKEKFVVFGTETACTFSLFISEKECEMEGAG